MPLTESDQVIQLLALAGTSQMGIGLKLNPQFLCAVRNERSYDFPRYVLSEITSRFWINSHACRNMILNEQVFMLDVYILVNENQLFRVSFAESSRSKIINP